MVGVMVMLSVGCLTMLSLSCAVEPTSAVAIKPGRLFAMQVLEPQSFATEPQQQELIDFCREYGVGRLVVRVELDLEPSEDGGPALADAGALRGLVELAADQAIQVVAAADPATPLETPQGRDQALAMIHAVRAFNEKQSPHARLAGVHYDLRRYTLWELGDWPRQALMRRCVEFFEVARAQTKQADPPLRLSVSVPHWYDQPNPEKNEMLVVDHYGVHKNFHEHLQDLTDELAVMCPRDADANGGVLRDQAGGELSYTQWRGRSVWVGLDTAKRLEKPGETYFGRPAWELWLQKRSAEQSLASYTGFSGVLISSYTGFRQILASQSLEDDASQAVAPRVFGMWLWHEKWISDESAHDEVLSFCEQYGIDLLPVQFHMDPGSVKRGQPHLKYPDQLRGFIEKANKRGVQIEALDGSPEMAMNEHRATVLAIIDAITLFNKTLPPNTTIAGLHYDIEPYLLPQWKTPQREEIMRQFLELLEAAALKIRLDAPRMKLSASVPFWYDLKTQPDDNCILDYNGHRKNFHEHIQDLTDYIVIMSYRRKALGEDSISAHVEVERAYAEWIGKYVCAGMETIPIKDRPEVSFHGVPPSEFWFQKEKLDHFLSRKGGYGGIVVHSYESFKPYLETPHNTQ